jgi:CRP-like cAMP-binding protein
MEVPGEALRITAKDLRRIMDDIPAVRQHLLDFVHAVLVQNMQLALCNVRHELEERLCRWLLLASDRLDEKAIPLTHDQLSIILGVRRSSVTTTLANLEEAGGVIKSRRAIEINRAILEKKTCECYRVIASEYARITGSGRHII